VKRSERLSNQAAREAWMSLVMICAGICAGGWSVRAWQAAPGWGALVAVIALTGVAIASLLAREALRLAQLADMEARFEHEREVRPRL